MTIGGTVTSSSGGVSGTVRRNEKRGVEGGKKL